MAEISLLGSILLQSKDLNMSFDKNLKFLNILSQKFRNRIGNNKKVAMAYGQLHLYMVNKIYSELN